jgi:hypothetical protein
MSTSPAESPIFKWVLILVGVGSAIDLAGKLTYRAMQKHQPQVAPWTPETAFDSAARLMDQTRREMSPSRMVGV